MINVPFLELLPAYLELKEEIDDAVSRSFATGWYIGGKDVELFERNYAEYCSAKHCIGVGNGLDALAIALTAFGVGPGDEVIVPSHTFIATWLAVSMTGASIVPVEPDEGTMNVTPHGIASAITAKTKAIVPVHLYGLPCDITAIKDIADAHEIPVIEDAAQAHGATLEGNRVGSFGTTCCWSFYPGKNLGAFGDGGAITTDDDAIAEKARMIANYGSRKKYVHEVIGVNSRLDPVQAAILNVRLAVLDKWNERRQSIADRYRLAFRNAEFEMQSIPTECRSSNHLFVIRHNDRQGWANDLAAVGIGTQIHYPIACRDQGGYIDSNLPLTPIASKLAAEVISLPIGPHMSPEQVDAVVHSVVALENVD
ncbi:dTDP-3-amino-3,6-dideoxy-alpha-D-galactopyranose transaminase [Fuerstiella marisgermanici]|uniref:dTDP-3-amino-3,6-dideoxy-alpha-D-galactopyranose transaminase n=2 Tax=Fuerstiella marisgermanici TaxID=1891926 RepID=A0A1P8WPG6_9PLAN|nr:dTDP-3-amino-3,6-dideoxy-alpha-D-galactopyranose transaminase [Fuerstiella marisgermanici]